MSIPLMAMKKFFEKPKNSDDEKAERLWLESCQERGAPYIVLRRQTKFSDVDWDYITYPPELNSGLLKSESKFKSDVAELFENYSNDKSSYSASWSLVSLKRIENEKAELAAADLYDLVERHMSLIKRNSII